MMNVKSREEKSSKNVNDARQFISRKRKGKERREKRTN